MFSTPVLPKSIRRFSFLTPAVALGAVFLLAGFPPETAGQDTDAAGPPALEVLFLGDSGSHQPAERAKQLVPAMLDRGIRVHYTEDVDRALTRDLLERYDVLLVYANIDTITEPQAEALLGYVEDGGGFAPIHSASYCFRNHSGVVELIGGQFQRHGTGVFTTRIAEPDHPVMDGHEPFESWDETYEHTLHNEENRTVLSYRQDEPYTWVRTHGQGRVFYTAWGHDERTWGHSGFQDLVERGLRWSAGQDVQEALASRTVDRPFEYVEQQIPYYPPGERSRGDGDWSQAQRPLSPEESMKRILVPGGFDLELFASEPDIRKPITMAFDERGRLWIVETVDYPNEVREPGEGRDRLSVLEDTTGDGKADSFTVFAENLNIPTGIAFANGGVLIYESPDTVFLKDTTGDGKADVREVIFSGWGKGDTHAMASNLRYGFDNWYWGSQGYSGFNGSAGGNDHRFGSGFHRFRKDGSELEFLRSTSNNTWGLAFSEAGLVFGSTANNTPSVFMPFANRYYAMADGLDAPVLPPLTNTSRFLPVTGKVRQVDVHGGYTSAAGHALYTARTWPEEYWNRIAFVADPTGHLAGEFVLTPDGAGFRAENPSNIFVSDDEWSAPIMAEVGPDGQLWVIDWYNYIVQHNPTPAGHETGEGNAYESNLRDKRHGRIYRVVYTGAEAAEPFSLHDAGAEMLLDTLGHDNLLWRQHAQRLLVERGRNDVVPGLIERVQDESVDEIGLNPGAIHALWTLHGLGELGGSNSRAISAAIGALNHPSSAVRRNAAIALPSTDQTGRALLEAGALEDEEAQVRLAALLALAEVPESRAIGEAIYRMHDDDANRGDPILEDAMIIAVNRHSEGFVAAAGADDRFAEETGEADLPNLLSNAPFEELEVVEEGENGGGAGWTVSPFRGEAEHEVVPDGRNGGSALQIRASEDASSSVRFEVDVEPETRYRLRGWIKTEDVTGGGGFFYALPFSLADNDTDRVRETSDWQQVETTFSSEDNDQISVAAFFGGRGGSTGTAWYSDVSLTEIGPASEGNRVMDYVRARFGDEADASAGDEQEEDEDTREIRLGVIPDDLRFDTEELTVSAGARIKVVFENTGNMPHNALFLAPGSLERIGRLADEMMMVPEGLENHYVPDSPDVLASTPIVNPDETHEIVFTVPDEPGEYPYVCTYPGHWRIMQGVMRVE